jgi:hypothetical protein
MSQKHPLSGGYENMTTNFSVANTKNINYKTSTTNISERNSP